MRALAIETSGVIGSVALAEVPSPHRPRAGGGPEVGRVLAEETFEKGLRHGQAIIPAVERALARAGVAKEAIDLFAVGIGPGSYTGLRVGIATAKALAIALERPCLGIASFDAAAREAAPAAFRGAASVVLTEEARKDRIYWGLYRPEGARLARVGTFEVRPPERALEGVPAPAVILHALRPHARAVARLALERALRGEGDRLDEVLPLYLRPSVPEERREGAAS